MLPPKTAVSRGARQWHSTEARLVGPRPAPSCMQRPGLCTIEKSFLPIDAANPQVLLGYAESINDNAARPLYIVG
jgi:hypothetical protein